MEYPWVIVLEELLSGGHQQLHRPFIGELAEVTDV